MTAILAHAIRFADLWAIDHHRMVDEIYSATIHMESMCRLDRAPVEGGEQLHELEDRLAAMIPEHRHELVRVVAGRDHACLETTVVSPTTGEYAPACVWWWMDGGGQVVEEVGFFDWTRRTNDSHRSHGFVPPNIGPTDASPRALLLDALARGDLAGQLAPDCVVEAVGIGPCELPTGRLELQETVADGAVVAALVLGRNENRVRRGTVVMTIGEAGVVSVRRYHDQAAIVALNAVHPGIRLDRQPQPG